MALWISSSLIAGIVKTRFLKTPWLGALPVRRLPTVASSSPATNSAPRRPRHGGYVGYFLGIAPVPLSLGLLGKTVAEQHHSQAADDAQNRALSRLCGLLVG